MLRKTLLTLCASALLGAAAIAPNAALAFGPPPPPMGGLGGPPHLGSPPMAHLGGLPHLGGPRLGGPAPRASLGGAAGRFNGPSRLGGRAGATSYGRSGGYGYGRSAHYGRGDYGSRHRYGRGGSYSDDGCYSTYTSSGRRVTVCDEN